MDHDGVNVDTMTADAEYPGGQLQRLQQLPAVLCVDVAVMVQMLAQQPQEEVCDVTICQVVGEPCKEIWEILPLSIADVSRVTRLDCVYGKLFNSVRYGNLDSNDKDLSKFNEVFSSMYITN